MAQSNSGGNNYFHANKITLGSPAKIVGLHIYCYAIGTTFQMAVYDDNAGSPNNRMTVSNVQVTGLGWNNVPVPGTATLPAGTYWIAFAASNMQVGYNGGVASNTGCFSWTQDVSDPAPALGGPLNGNIFSMYADTCP